MKPSTRAALRLAPGATDADAATALDAPGHGLALRELEKSDPAFVLYLKKQAPDVYGRLFAAQYGGQKPGAAAPAPAANPAKGQPAKQALAALGPDVTLRQLERKDAALLETLRLHAPDEYSRLYRAQYGKPCPYALAAPAVAPAPLRLAAPVAPVAPVAPLEGAAPVAYRLKAGNAVALNGLLNPAELAHLPTLAVPLAQDPRFERV